MADGLLMVYASANPENNTSPLGQVFRALGRGLNVCIVACGEDRYEISRLASQVDFGGLLECHPKPSASDSIPTRGMPDPEEISRLIPVAEDAIQSDRFQLVVLDGLGDLIADGLVDSQDAVTLLSARPPHVHVLVTGMSVPDALRDVADLITQVQELKPGGH